MKFSERMIELAVQFKAGGVPWTPAAGDYVLDREGIVDRGSPFQPGVYFVLNYDHFMRLAGGEDAFRRRLVWLPTWEQCREILRQSGMTDGQLQAELVKRNAIAGGTERLAVYELIADRYPVAPGSATAGSGFFQPVKDGRSSR